METSGIRYDRRCYFNAQNQQLKSGKQKKTKKVKKTDMLRSIGKTVF